MTFRFLCETGNVFAAHCSCLLLKQRHVFTLETEIQTNGFNLLKQHLDIKPQPHRNSINLIFPTLCFQKKFFPGLFKNTLSTVQAVERLL
jgi:hypothetical protein